MVEEAQIRRAEEWEWAVSWTGLGPRRSQPPGGESGVTGELQRVCEQGRSTVLFLSYKDPSESGVGCLGGQKDTRHLERGLRGTEGRDWGVGSN